VTQTKELRKACNGERVGKVLRSDRNADDRTSKRVAGRREKMMMMKME
jgi:hypothetical protein